MKVGTEKGLKEGLQQGIEQGIEQNKIDIAKNMISKGIDINFISEITGLSIEKINILYN